MTPIQQLMLGAGGAKKKTYLEDVFSTTLYTGNMTDRNINTGLDMSGEGGLAWLYVRTGSAGGGWMFDTERGYNKFLRSSDNNGEGTETTMVSGFTSTGFSLDGDGSQSDNTNNNNARMVSWNFRNANGFFKVVKWTGNGTNGRQISHGLGSIPGCIMVKRTDANGDDWMVYHRANADTSNAGNYWLKLNNNDAKGNSDRFYDLEPTATYFTVSDHETVNTNTYEYVAYVFAGGESTAATARSVKYNGGSLVVNNHSDLDIGSGDFTIEFWFKPLSSSDHHSLIALSKYGSNVSGEISLQIYEHDRGHKIFIMDGSSYTDVSHQSKTFGYGSWSHFAWTRSGSGSNNNKIFINGSLVDQFSNNFSPDNGQSWIIGANDWGQDGTPNQYTFDGNISNVRFTKGQVLYTTSFKPSTTPLTTTSQGANSSNVKLLCCNNSSVTGSTVSPTSIETHGTTPTASIESPFDDPAGFVFGDNEDQNVIKTGTYIGNQSTDGPKVFLGFEPQWLLIKNTEAAEGWWIYDSKLGLVTVGNDEYLHANQTNTRNSMDMLDLMSDGFRVKWNDANINGSGDVMAYIAIRRPDGYVGKPIVDATKVFAMTTGKSGASSPNYQGGNVVDFHMTRDIDSSNDWFAGARLIGTDYLRPNTNGQADASGTWLYDYMDGYNTGSSGSDWQSWQWKRHAGLDVVAWKGSEPSGIRAIPHNLARVPEMIWMKARNYDGSWSVYHKGLNGGTNPEQYNINLNSNNEEADFAGSWADTAPTSTHWTVGQDNAGNGAYNYFAVLFASIAGISKCGYYTGNGTSDSSTQTITTGFQPRFIIIKSSSNDEHWVVFDTTRGWSSGSTDQLLELNNTDAQQSLGDFGHPISTGFVLKEDASVMNLNNHKYIYYAHA